MTIAGDARNVLQQVVDELAHVYDARGSVVWLNAIQDWTKGKEVFRSSAFEAIYNGEGEVVLTKIEQLTTGAFS